MMTTIDNDFDINNFLGAEIEHSKVGRLARQPSLAAPQGLQPPAPRRSGPVGPAAAGARLRRARPDRVVAALRHGRGPVGWRRRW